MRSPPEAYAKKSLTVLPFPPLTSSKPSELLKQRKKQRRFQKQTRQDQIQSTLHNNLSILYINWLSFLLLSTNLKFPPQSLIRQMMITLWKTSPRHLPRQLSRRHLHLLLALLLSHVTSIHSWSQTKSLIRNLLYWLGNYLEFPKKSLAD